MNKLCYIFLFVLLLFGVSCTDVSKTESQSSSAILKFDDKGEFKIAQFTDIHWDESATSNDSTRTIIKNVLETEKPDLAILSGDIVCYEPAEEGWLSIAKMFGEKNIPWVVLMGNHDEEQEMTRQQIDSLLELQPNYLKLEDVCHKNESGDFYLLVKSSDNKKNAASIYCFNSNTYPDNTLLYGKYDWIHSDQIAWYREHSLALTKQNGEVPLPSLAYFHIPLPEYNTLIAKGDFYGMNREGRASSPDINSGLFASLIEMGDVMATFVGHDHDNCFIGQMNGIGLSYGRVSGLRAYGDLERGARIVKLYEGKRQFDTWIRTNSGKFEMYYYPSGITKAEEESAKYLDPVDLTNPKQGVRYKYFEYEGKIISVEALTDPKIATLKEEGILKNFSLEPAKRKDYFGLEFEAYLKVPKDGIYNFYTYTDDGSVLYIGDQLVVDNDGSHSAKLMEGKVGLKAGYHKIRLKYFESYMGEQIEVGISGRDIPRTIIADDMLYIVE
ncbi:metallophosphoesterase [Dysgonomonas sp. Marseille-P4361]|uniref:metallophosphoesterase n=1 Tax=Dysgonomonas sp. Marseille-P4361 TaxID=2161820 RepID=UPI000D55DBB3|nr:metallophosphoesterase [Dysgonomonas sp. Marseille-P4361]